MKTSLKEYLDDTKKPFSLSEFKNIKSYKGRVDYANSHLPKLGSGSSRTVYDLGNNTVLKLAKNLKGIAQNKTEAGLSNENLSIITEVKDYDETFIYVVMEKAEKMKPNEFKQFFKYDINTLNYFFRNYYEQSKGKRPIFSMDSNIENDLYENDYVMEIISLYDNYNILPQDFGRLANWGVVIRNGERKPVVIDFGFDNKTAATYYNIKENFIKKQYLKAFNEDNYNGTIGEWLREWIKY